MHKALTLKRAKRPETKRLEIMPLTGAQQNVCCAQGQQLKATIAQSTAQAPARPVADEP